MYICIYVYMQYICIYMWAFIYGPANGEFCLSFLTCRANIHQRCKIWFHFNLKWND